MKTSKQQFGARQTVLALAVLAAFTPAHAEDDEVAQMIKPSSSISAGIGGTTGSEKDHLIFGQYNGKRDGDLFGLLDLDYVTRDEATGTWTTLKGSNLGLDTRELGFSQQKQGDWKYSAEYSSLVRNYPRIVNTGMIGAGTTTPTVVRLTTPGTGSELDLKTKRESVGLGGEKWITRSLQLELNFKDEQKKGARLWGRGYDCAAYVCGSSTSTAINQASFVKNAILMLPEPINSTTKQIDAKLNFHDEKLLLTGGYYGSFYHNEYGTLTPIVPNSFNNGLGQPLPGYPAVNGTIIPGGGMSLQNVLQTPMALPPDNQAHQFYLDGNYAFTPTTKANFKYAFTHATQNDNFSSKGLTGAPAGVSSLNAQVDSTLAQLGFSTRPIDKLTVLGNIRYEHKDDKTPTALYNVEAKAVVPATNPASFTNVGAFWNNNNTTTTKVASKLEASYRLPENFRFTAGIDHSTLEREVPTSITDENVAGLGALREKNSETGYRFELRHSMSETLNAGISYLTSRRTGSSWTSLSTLDPATPGISAANLALINLYCGGVACYGQKLPDGSILALSSTTPFPINMTDLQRDKLKLSADWNPAERVSLQFVVEDGKDKNTAGINPIAGGKGWQGSGVRLYSVDGSFAVSDNWKVLGSLSYGDQTLHVNHSTGYMANIEDLNETWGLGFVGKPTGRLEVGANLAYMRDENRYGLVASPSATGTAASASNIAQAGIGLPNVMYRQITLNVFSKYALDQKSDLRFDLVRQRVSFNEWQWSNNGVPFTYADNTTVQMPSEQRVTYLGVTYIYRF
jgi:MtrB/PioB family decaheme-associated outer membrane protein